MPDIMPRPVLLIVDDDPLIVDSLSFVLRASFEIRTAASRSEAMQRARSGPTPKLALIDLGLPPHPHDPVEGFGLVSELLAFDPQMLVVVLSGQNAESNARHARTLGAIEFVAKPAEPEALRKLLTKITRLQSDSSAASGAATESSGLIGSSPAMTRLRAQLKQFSTANFPVLIEGESGTGKELAARALHTLSPRNQQAFLALNCAAISPSLVEATLFGHAKGAFTGAASARTGYFEDASGGSLFLDEIGELPQDLQPKLLRVLEDGEFQRVGETQVRRSTARVIAATNRDLRSEVRQGRFRGDLFHRLSVLAVAMPALRELGTDRVQLFEHFNRIYAAQAGASLLSLAPESLERFSAYSFPGNVRELRNIVIRLTAKHPGAEISLVDLECELDIEFVDSAPPHADDTALQADGPVLRAMRHLKDANAFNLDDELRHVEGIYIEAAQRLADGNFSQAARLLGVSRTTLYSRMEASMRQRRT